MSTFRLHIGSAMFPTVADTRDVPAGTTVLDALRGLGSYDSLRAQFDVAIQGERLDEAHWPLVKPKAGTLVSVGIRPGNILDNGALRTLGMIASAFGGEWIGQNAGGKFGPFLGMGLKLAGVWAVTTLIPPPAPEPDALPNASGFRNDFRKWGKVPRVYGMLRIFPPPAAESMFDVIGNDQYTRAVFALGQRPLMVLMDTVKLGETPLSQFSGWEMEIHDGYQNWSTEQFYIYSRDVREEVLNRELRWARQWRQNAAGVPVPGGAAGELDGSDVLNRNVVTLRTAANCVEFQLDLTFPDGLGHDRGEEYNGYNVDLAVRYRPAGASGRQSWVNVPASAVESQEYFNGEVNPITDTDIFEWLVGVNGALDDAIDDLTAIITGERIVSELLWQLALNRIGQIQRILVDEIDLNDGLSSDERELIENTQTKLDDLAVLVQEAERTTQQFTDELINFNSILSAAITAIEIVDGILGFMEYIRRGYGPESALNGPFPNVSIRRWVAYKWGLQQVFSDPPTGTFRLVNADRVKGIIRKQIIVPTPPGEYEVQVRRVSQPVWDEDELLGATNPDPAYSAAFHEKVELTAFRTIQAGAPFSDRARRRHAMMAVKVKLTGQTGNIDNLNVVVQSPLPWYKPGVGWQAAALQDDAGRPVYKCPAWIACDILRGTGAKEPPSDDHIDVDRFVEWADYCFENALFFSGLFDAKTTIRRALEDVCRVGKASPSIRNGMHSVVYDHVHDAPVDILTPRNSRGLTVKHLYSTTPHALRIPFVNPDKDWADDELIVYDDTHGPEGKEILVTRPAEGDKIVLPFLIESVLKLELLRVGEVPFGIFSVVFPEDVPNTTWIVKNPGEPDWTPGNYRALVAMPAYEAERFETVSIKGLVDSHDETSDYHTGQVYALGRYLLKSMALRPEVLTCELDFEHLKFERGDRVDVQHDVTLWGIGSGRLAAAPTRNGGGNITALKFDCAVLMAADKSYQVRVRAGDGAIFLADLVTVPGANATVTLATPLDDDWKCARLDLAMWGEKSRVSVPCIVKEIQKRGDLTAQITFVEHAEAVHDAPGEPIPPFDSQITIPPQVALARPPMPEITGITTDETVLVRGADGTLQSRIRAAFRIPEGATEAERAIAARVSHVQAQIRLQYRLTVVNGLPVLYTPDAQNAWTDVGYITRDAGMVFFSPVQDGLYYDVRLRAITRGGVQSDWNLETDVRVIGKTSPPPDVLNARVDGQDLRWDYPVPPSDLRGFLVRQLRGEGGSWASAEAAHEGVLSASVFSLAPFPGGPREFYVKAVDTSSNESATAARVVVADGTVPVPDEVTRFEHSGEGWPGARTDMEEDGANLVSTEGSMSGFYAGPGAPYYRGLSTPYYTTEYPHVAYEFDHVVDDGGLPYFLSIELAAGGAPWQLDVRKVDAPFWPADMTQPIWPAQGDQPIWPDLEYHAYRGRIEAEAGVTYRFRIHALGCNNQLVITQLDEVTTPVERTAS